MNKERVLQVAAIVEKGYHKFNGITAMLFMPSWILKREHYYSDADFFEQLPVTRSDINGHSHECNTTACIAGFACLVLDYEKTKNYDIPNIEDHARELLGLTYTQASALFSGYAESNITGPQAAAVMRHFAETGIINWGIALSFPETEKA